MSYGKLRLSWGLTGNNRTQTPYDFYSQITVNPGSGNSLDYVFGGERVPGYYVSNMANERLKWETTEQWNAGLDLGFFEDRIKVTADWYDKVTRDLLLYALLPASSGFEQGMLNIGKIRNRGFELTLETVNVKTRQFQWSTSFNIAFNRNRILGLVDGQNTLQSSVSWETRFNSQFPYISQVGKPTGMMYGFIYDGTYKAEDFDDKGNLVSGVPSALFWRVVTCSATILPVVRTALVCAPLAAYLAVEGSWGAAVGLMAYGVLVVTQSDNVIRFILQKRMADTHPLVTILGVLIGLPLFGFMGVIFGPLLLAMFVFFVHIFKRKYLDGAETARLFVPDR